MTQPTTDSLIAYWRQGEAIIEAALAKAVAADPLDAPMPLHGGDAKLYHQGAADAYRHALEMMAPGDTPDIAYWLDGQKIVASCLATSAAGDWLDAPMPLHGAQAKIYLQARADAFGHAIEMMGYPEDATEETLLLVNVRTAAVAPVLAA